MKTTLTSFCCLCLVFGLAAIKARGQAVKAKEQHQYVEAPRDVALTLVVAQPESPLEFVEIQLFVNVSTRAVGSKLQTAQPWDETDSRIYHLFCWRRREGMASKRCEPVSHARADHGSKRG